jgi:serine/threonine protein kinase
VEVFVPDLIGKSLSRYHILEQLGEGGMATVYKAFDTRVETDVAVKVIRTEKFTPEVLARALKRFEREAKALARLTHPNIVKVMDYGEYENRPYLVMPYLPGGNLKQLLKERGRLNWQEAVKLLLPIAEALDYAHSQNIIHRDVKPSNILLTERGQPMLTDFGVAKILEEEATIDLTGTGMGVGTPEYMAPEQFQAKSVDRRADLYSLGVVFFEMVSGRKPYTADTPAAVIWKQASEPLPRPKQFVPELPDGVEKILLKALAKKPEDRYQSMDEFAAALEKIGTRDQSPVISKKVTSEKPKEKRIDAKRAIDQHAPPSSPRRVERPVQPARFGWKRWVPIVVLVAILGIGLIVGGGLLLKMSQQGQGLLGGQATKTAAPTFTPIRTSTLFATVTPTATLPPILTPTSITNSGQGKIAFISCGGSDQIYTINPDGSELNQLTDNNTYSFGGLNWSPDGRAIGYTYNFGYNDYTKIDIIDANAGSNKIVSDLSPIYGYQPIWSPDGKQLIFIGTKPQEYGIYLINPDGSGKIRLASSGSNPIWLPDGSKIVFNDQRNLYMINPDGSGKTQLADDVYSYHNFALSPDGSKIAYVDNPNSVTKQQDLYVINLNSLEKTRLVTDVGGSFAWSSDSLKIAFVDRWIGQTNKQDLYVINADGSDKTQVATGSWFSYTWSPVGHILEYVADNDSGGLSTSLNVYNLNLGETTALTSENGGYITNVSWSQDATELVFVIYDYWSNKGNAYLINIDGSNKRLLTNNVGCIKGASWFPSRP